MAYRLCRIPHTTSTGLGQQEVQLEYDAVSGSLDVITSQPPPSAPAAPSAPPAPVPAAPMAPAAGVGFLVFTIAHHFSLFSFGEGASE